MNRVAEDGMGADGRAAVLGRGKPYAPPGQRVEQMVAFAAAVNPTAIAIEGPDATLTYAELEGRSNQLAAALLSAEVARESIIGLCLERSAAMIVGALGILKAGGAYLALDPSYPDERLRFMLRDSGTRVVVTTKEIADRLRVDDFVLPPTGAGDDKEADWVPVEGSERDLAYVIYTSGSTGTPKGVLVEHASLGNLIAWHRTAFNLTASDRGTQISSPGFDAAVWEIWPYLASGASIHIPGERLRTDPALLRDWIVARGITVAFLPTALAEAAIALDWPGDTPLRHLLTGGDALHRRPTEGLPFTLVNNYGVTEATVVSTSGEVEPYGEAAVPTLGRPIDGVTALVVDAELCPVALGEPGELLIGGVSVARGYLNRPELTAERFVSDGASDSYAERLYRTGDLVRSRPDGDIEFLGRLDDQVKIRGFRIELGEIAAALDAHPDIRSSVVVAQGEPADKRLIAYLVAVGSSRLDAPDLRQFIARRLPEHMLPARFVWLPELPVTLNGKVDVAALATHVEDPQRAVPVQGPTNSTEEQVAAMVAQLLGLETVGVNENFFLLGGHSLLGAQLIARLADRFGVEMSLRSLFDGPTAADIAGEVARLMLAEVEDMTDDQVRQLLESPPGA